METQNKTYNQILLEAANLLEHEINPWGKWGKGSYFKNIGQGCSMCAHGAIAYCGNDKVRKYINQAIPQTNAAAEAVAAARILDVASRARYFTDLAQKESLSLEDYIRKYYNGESGLAHYKAAKSGLSFAYNDAPKTTKEDVINKLREAATL